MTWKEQQALIHLCWHQKTDLVDLKTNVDDLNVDRLKIVPADVSKLGNGVDNGVKKTVL